MPGAEMGGQEMEPWHRPLTNVGSEAPTPESRPPGTSTLCSGRRH